MAVERLDAIASAVRNPIAPVSVRRIESYLTLTAGCISKYEDRLADIYRAAFGEAPWLEAYTQDQALEILRRSVSRPRAIVRAGVGSDGNIVGGTASYSFDEGNSLWGIPDVMNHISRAMPDVFGILYLDELFVDPEYQRHGFGTNLILDAERQTKEAGFRHVILRTAATYPPLIDFYVKNGYDLIALQHDAPLNRLVDGEIVEVPFVRSVWAKSFYAKPSPARAPKHGG